MDYTVECFITIEAASRSEAVQRMAAAEELIDRALADGTEGVLFHTESTSPDYGVEEA